MRLFSAALLALLTWGALAFGAEYAWSYAPLLVFAVVVGVLGLRVSRGAVVSRPLFVGLAVIVAAVALQFLSPRFLANAGSGSGTTPVGYNRLRAQTLLQPAPADPGPVSISISSDRTALGLAFLLSLAVLLLGGSRAMATHDPQPATRGIVALGVVVALVGIAQASLRSEAVYGFWHPPKGGVPFAPFVNENHCAGWLVMVMSLTAGWFTGGFASALRHAPSSWRQRVLWSSSPDASETVLTGFSVGVMGLAMAVTLSRGGLVGLTTAAAILIWWVLRRQSSRRLRIGGVASLAIVFVAAALWGGVGRTLVQFDATDLTWGGRKQVWLDTLRIIHDYPWTGTGLNTYGIAMLHYQTTPRGDYFIEAHNDYLQLAAEGGLLLGIPILITIALFIREVWKRFKEGADDERTYWLRAGAVTGLCSIAVMEIFDFTLQMPGAAVLFVVLCAIAIHRPDYLKHRSSERRRES